jgi:hypothetical protein
VTECLREIPEGRPVIRVRHLDAHEDSDQLETAPRKRPFRTADAVLCLLGQISLTNGPCPSSSRMRRTVSTTRGSRASMRPTASPAGTMGVSASTIVLSDHDITIQTAMAVPAQNSILWRTNNTAVLGSA